jgi:hypothetical protein
LKKLNLFILKVYNAFGEINFVAYDFASVKQSLIDYIKLKYPENFNDYTDSSGCRRCCQDQDFG